ncbi:MAG: signal peptidase I [Clostridia bacterium]|nr:signal peptidase I [Clostridia bacterium]
MQKNNDTNRELSSGEAPQELDATAIADDDSFGTGEIIQTKSKLSSDIFDFLEMLVVAACAIILLFSFVVRLSSVEGTSMVGTLDDGDKLVVSGLFYEPKQGDIVVFQDLENELHKGAIVKRVIAVGGQTVKLKYTPSGTVNTLTITVDGVELKESYRYYDPLYFNKQAHTGEYTYTVPDGSLFVMGDNTYISDDSRGSFGYVDEDKVIGRVVFRLCGQDLSSLFVKFGTVQ